MEKGRALAQIDMDFLLERFIIDTTKKQEKTLYEYYLEQQKKYMQNQSTEDYSLLNLL